MILAPVHWGRKRPFAKKAHRVACRFQHSPARLFRRSGLRGVCLLYPKINQHYENQSGEYGRGLPSMRSPAIVCIPLRAYCIAGRLLTRCQTETVCTVSRNCVARCANVFRFKGIVYPVQKNSRVVSCHSVANPIADMPLEFHADLSEKDLPDGLLLRLSAVHGRQTGTGASLRRTTPECRIWA